ncbi:DUF692 domain-containing protein [Streptomyces sp. NPDC001922]|uniref:DUF692 domain-containing protein n=1 Tax=Streptomyces sp. NPDC001922 TaxID=3364624 RepID=UPI0036917A34
MERLGTGIGWRPEIAGTVAELPGLDWVEVVAENICPGHLPEPLQRLRERGTTIVPHGVSLGLGGADRPDPGRLAALAERAEALGAPLVTEHIAFVRAGGLLTASPELEAGHLLPVPRTREALDVLCENVRIAQDALPVPLALENIAALIAWPGEELTEGQFLSELVERTGVRLLIDVANLHTNHVNRGEDPAAALDGLPVDAIAYVHVAGGVEKDGVWHDSHAHPVTEPVLEVLADLCSRTEPPGVLLERDEDFPPPGELEAELDTIRGVVARSAGERTAAAGRTPSPAPVPALREPAAPLPDGAAAAAGDAARQRLALAQTALLSALVAGTPAPEGFDHGRLRVQSRALRAKRADVVAKVAPELPDLLGSGYRPAFLRYARTRPMSGGYRRDALDFAEHLLHREGSGHAADPAVRRQLETWWRERSGPAPLPRGRLARLLAGMRRTH